MKEIEIIEQIKKGIPFEGLRGIKLTDVLLEQKNSKSISYNSSYNLPSNSDLTLTIDFSGIQIIFIGEIKSLVTPKILEQISPWVTRVRDSKPKQSYILITPYITTNSQNYCLNNDINFLDLSGNLFIKIPGKVMIQRLGQPNKFPVKQILRNPFWGASSRVLRVLLQYPKRIWSVSEIEEELLKESEIQKVDFKLSLASISKTIRSLDEELLIRRDQREILVPEPKQLLFKWAEKYREMNRRTGQEFSPSNNPFGTDVINAVKQVISELPDFANSFLMGPTAANIVAPYLEIDKILLYVVKEDNLTIPEIIDPSRSNIGPEFEFYDPPDAGVFMYAKEIEGLRITSDIQIYLDCYSKGGRDLKQADYLLEKVIEKRWAGND